MLDSADGWKSWIGEDFFTKEVPRLGWALVSREVLPESLNKNYLQQTEVIVNTLRDGVFKGMEMPEEYATAIKEFESKKDKLAKLIDEDWQEAAKQFAGLKITQLARQTIPETIYDVAMYYDRNNKRLLSDTYSWSASLHPESGSLVSLGDFGSKGVVGGGWRPGPRGGYLGVSLSRRL